MTNQANTTQVQKLVIKNIAGLSDEHLAKILTDYGIEVPEFATKTVLIGLAREHGLWDYSGKSVVPSKYRAIYKAHGGNCGDQIAAAFSSLVEGPLEDSDLASVAVANGIDFGRWSHCNAGQKRMNLSNVLRGKIKRGENVIIGTFEWEKGNLTNFAEEAPQEEVKVETTEPVVEQSDETEVETH